MGDVVDLKPVHLEENHEFVADCCRFQEGILTEANMKLKYRFADSIWEKLGDNTALLEAVEAEKVRRIRTGQQKRERAQVLVTKAPDVVAKIMLDDNANPRHRIDASKALDDFASKGPEAAAAAAADRFIITINLGADHVEHYNKSISINADDVAPGDSNSVPREMVAAIADKPWDDSDVVAAPVKSPAPMRTGYKPVDHEKISDKKPVLKTVKHEKLPAKTPMKTPQEIALEAMMNRGWE